MIAGVEITKLNKHFMIAGYRNDVLKGFTASFPEQEIVVILGKSGCGKTTLLRIIVELEAYDSGEMLKPPTDAIGMVFQEPRLMPWLTVYENIIFGLKKSQLNQEAILEVMRLTELSGFEKAYPHQLSGGMQQRTAIARTLLCEPEMILLDEPFASLDYFTREMMQNKLLEIHAKTQKSVIFVTHNIDEALILGQRIIIMGDGGVKKEYNLTSYHYPRDLLDEQLIALKKNIMIEIGGTK